LSGQNVPKFEKKSNEEQPQDVPVHCDGVEDEAEEEDSEPADGSVILRPRGGFGRPKPRFYNTEKEQTSD